MPFDESPAYRQFQAFVDQARRELRQNPAWAHPFFWAPFIVYAPD